MSSGPTLRCARFVLFGSEPPDRWLETWKHCPALFCPACGTPEVWREDAEDASCEGSPYLCAACLSHWTMPRAPAPAEGRDLERLRNIRRGFSS